MGIEPTWDFIRPHAGFEVQGIHQASCRSRFYPLITYFFGSSSSFLHLPLRQIAPKATTATTATAQIKHPIFFLLSIKDSRHYFKFPYIFITYC